MFFLLQACFWIKAALEHVFLSPLRPHALNLLGQGFLLLWFCFCPKATLENVVPVGVFFWREVALDKVWNWEDLRLSGREVCRMNFFFEELLVRIFENFALKMSRLEDLSICVFANQKVWGCEDEKICRCEEDTKLKKGCENERMRLCEELKVWGQEYK